MPNVSGIAALDVLIGLFFLYFLLSIVCSSMNEAIAAVLNMRAAYLEDGIRALLSREGNVKAFYSSWRMRTLIKPPGRFFKRPRKPSYIPPRTFALTLLDTFAPPANAAENDDLIGRAQRALGHPKKTASRGGRPRLFAASFAMLWLRQKATGTSSRRRSSSRSTT